MDNMIPAVLYAASAPEKDLRDRLMAFLREKYGEVDLSWKEDASLSDGFRLEVGDEVYDWTEEGRFEQLKQLFYAAALSNDTIPLLKDELTIWTPKALAQEVGTVTTVGDNIATVKGLKNVFYGEILLFSSGVRGMVQNLSEDSAGCILFDEEEEVCQGSKVRRTNKTAGIPVGDGFVGRVVDALGVPLDGKGPVKADSFRSIESAAPGIVDRQPVDKPLETGLLVVDSMFPIGRGQRELIIGDRQTGKTAIALDTIINQKGKDVICIYVAIGQKVSSVARITETLKNHGAMDYTIVVCAGAGDSAPLQYIAPYTGCALGEYFMHRGKDVLVVYDDLSKHAVAYRALSLLLGRSPGREAFPGDVFYLHSRLLERAAHLSDEEGGGSITALPIVETQAGDVTSYIPTNIISITDGQLYLETNLFLEGQRPAINVGLSVSRVGRDAQTKAMKRASGSLRIDLAQYREMEVFTQFSADLDESAKKQISYGKILMRLLRQPQSSPMSQHEQVITLVCALEHVADNLGPAKADKFFKDLREYFENSRPEICSEIDSTGQLTDETRGEILGAARDFTKAWSTDERLPAENNA